MKACGRRAKPANHYTTPLALLSIGNMHKLSYPRIPKFCAICTLTSGLPCGIMGLQDKERGNKEMTNLPLFNKLIEGYNAHAFTHSYIYGFYFQNKVWMVETDSDVNPYILTLDKASRGQGYSLRFKPTKAQKLVLMAKAPRLICSKEFFDAEVKSSKYNKGEIFEKMVAELYGQTWEKDRVPFWEGGDLEINGKAYQVKFEKATFTNEKTLARL